MICPCLDLPAISFGSFRGSKVGSSESHSALAVVRLYVTWVDLGRVARVVRFRMFLFERTLNQAYGFDVV